MKERVLNNRYTLEAEIGRGGMGVVYRAEDAQVKRTVAIKTLPSLMTHNQELLRRFNSEVQHASKLSHPNIVRVFDVGEDAGTHYYVMQYIDGKSLRELLKEKGCFTLEEALPILEQVATALDYAYSQGIVHRDIKPENILIDQDGHAFVLDFGVAKAAEGTRTTRGMLGTPEYMSPEQIRGEAVDGRSDQYSFAVVAYEMLTGRTPFKESGEEPLAIIHKHLTVAPPNPHNINILLSNHVSDTLLKALAKNKKNRYQSCQMFVNSMIHTKSVSNQVILGIKGLIALVIISLLLIAMYERNNSSTSISKSPQKDSGSKIVFVDTSTPKLNAIVVADKEGKSQRRIAWVNQIEYFTNNGSMFGGNVRNDESDVIEKVELINSEGNSVFDLNIENFNKQTNTDLDCLAAMSSNGKYLAYLCIDYQNKYNVSTNDYGHHYYALYLYDVSKGIYTRIESFLLESSFGAHVNPCVLETNPAPEFSNDGSQIIYSHMDGSIYIASFPDWTPKQLIKCDSKPQSFKLTPDGKHLIVEINERKINIVTMNNGMNNSITFKNGMTAFCVTNKNIYAIEGQVLKRISLTDNILSEIRTNIGSTIKNISASEDDTFLAFESKNSDIITIDQSCGRQYNIGHGSLLGWIYTDKLIGTEIKDKKSEVVIGLPNGGYLTDKYTVDIDGDGKPEQLYRALVFKDTPTGKISKGYYWIVKGDKVVWTFLNDDQNKYRIILKDITRDNIPEIIICHDVSEWERGCLIFSHCNGKIQQISDLALNDVGKFDYVLLNTKGDVNIFRTTQDGSVTLYSWKDNKFIINTVNGNVDFNSDDKIGDYINKYHLLAVYTSVFDHRTKEISGNETVNSK